MAPYEVFRVAIALGMVAAMGAALYSGPAHAEDARETMRKTFKAPPASCRPHTRWWWMGNAITKDDLTWQLQQMDKQGIGVDTDKVGPQKKNRVARNSVQPVSFFGVPTGIRTPVAAVKGRCPRPLDDGDRRPFCVKIPACRCS